MVFLLLLLVLSVHSLAQHHRRCTRWLGPAFGLTVLWWMCALLHLLAMGIRRRVAKLLLRAMPLLGFHFVELTFDLGQLIWLAGQRL